MWETKLKLEEEYVQFLKNEKSYMKKLKIRKKRIVQFTLIYIYR